MSRALFYVGSINRALPYLATADGPGIAAFWLDETTGECEPAETTAGIDNPVFVAVHPNGRTLFATSEVNGWNEGLLSAYAIDPSTGALEYLCKQPTRGDIVAHCDVDRSGRFVAAVNYCMMPVIARPDRSVIVYPLAPDGVLEAPVADMRHHGTGTSPIWQERSHAHCVRWSSDNRFMVVADLGLDRLIVYRFDATSGTIAPHGGVDLPPGSGPRHFLFHPQRPRAYVVNEGSSTVSSLSFDPEAGTFELLATETTTGGAAGHNQCSAIKLGPGGRHLYVGNRIQDSIARFALDKTSGIARFVEVTPSGGRTPRDLSFSPSGELLLVANQESGLLAVFRCDADTGALVSSGQTIATGSPTAIAFVPPHTSAAEDLR